MDTTDLDAWGKRDRAREPAEPPLADGVVPVLVALSTRLLLRDDLVLAGDGEHVVVHVDRDVFLVQTGQLERRRHEVLLSVLMQVHPVHALLASGSLQPVKRDDLPRTERTQRRILLLELTAVGTASARRECLVEEVVEIGERVERLVEESGKRHLVR